MAKPDNKKQLYFGEPLMRLVDLLNPEQGQLSPMLNGAVDRYLDLMEAHRPRLSRNEWLAICDCLNGTMIDDTFLRMGAAAIAHEIGDAVVLEDLATKWDIDGPALIAKATRWTKVEAFAALHVATVFWAHSELDRDEALAKAGIKG